MKAPPHKPCLAEALDPAGAFQIVFLLIGEMKKNHIHTTAVIPNVDRQRSTWAVRLTSAGATKVFFYRCNPTNYQSELPVNQGIDRCNAGFVLETVREMKQ